MAYWQYCTTLHTDCVLGLILDTVYLFIGTGWTCLHFWVINLAVYCTKLHWVKLGWVGSIFLNLQWVGSGCVTQLMGRFSSGCGKWTHGQLCTGYRSIHRKHLQIWGWKRGICAKVAFAIQKPAITMKRSSLDLNLLQGVYINLCMSNRLAGNLVTQT